MNEAPRRDDLPTCIHCGDRERILKIHNQTPHIPYPDYWCENCERPAYDTPFFCTEALPPKADNPKGVHAAYTIRYIDGKIPEEEEIFFVLRIDKNGNNPRWNHVCRLALEQLAYLIRVESISEEHVISHADDIMLSNDILKLLAKIEHAYHFVRPTAHVRAQTPTTDEE